MLTGPQQRLRNVLGHSWYTHVGALLTSDEMKVVAKRVNERRKSFNVKVFPHKDNTFKALRLCGLEDTKVVILGVNPYHTTDVADGLAFSSQDPFERPEDMKNIAREVETSIYDGLKILHEADLSRLANQGVLLLNTILSVEKGKDLSHEKMGWQAFTKVIVQKLLQDEEPKVFMLWGMATKAFFQTACKEAMIEDVSQHLILEAASPSSPEFLGCNHFVLANEFLMEKQRFNVVW